MYTHIHTWTLQHYTSHVDHMFVGAMHSHLLEEGGSNISPH